LPLTVLQTLCVSPSLSLSLNRGKVNNNNKYEKRKSQDTGPSHAIPQPFPFSLWRRRTQDRHRHKHTRAPCRHNDTIAPGTNNRLSGSRGLSHVTAETTRLPRLHDSRRRHSPNSPPSPTPTQTNEQIPYSSTRVNQRYAATLSQQRRRHHHHEQCMSETKHHHIHATHDSRLTTHDSRLTTHDSQLTHLNCATVPACAHQRACLPASLPALSHSHSLSLSHSPTHSLTVVPCLTEITAE